MFHYEFHSVIISAESVNFDDFYSTLLELVSNILFIHSFDH